MRILVSACLLGFRCRYDGQEKRNGAVCALAGRHTLVPFCPEQAGGLDTPRPPAEIRGDRVVTQDGTDVTQAFRDGADAALSAAADSGCELAVLKDRSPSCGSSEVYDGSFSRRLRTGEGVTCARLRSAGIRVISERDAELQFPPE